MYQVKFYNIKYGCENQVICVERKKVEEWKKLSPNMVVPQQ